MTSCRSSPTFFRRHRVRCPLAAARPASAATRMKRDVADGRGQLVLVERGAAEDRVHEQQRVLGRVVGERAEPQVAVELEQLDGEAALDGVRDELPHSLAVVVEEVTERDEDTTRPGNAERGGVTRAPLLDVRVNIFVERDSQKAIIIGRGGARLREVGTVARSGIESLLGRRVYLHLRVKVAKDWQRDPKQLQRLGF